MKKSVYGILAVILLSAGISSTTSALTFSQDIGVSFTFNTALNVSLSSNDLIIANLAPGTASDSNIITVNVATNNPTGYTLNATVGNNSTYNTRDLIHQSSNVTNKFNSVAYGSSIASLTNLSDNTWAFSYLDESLNNGTNTTWENYSGLPLYSDTTNITTLKTANGPASSASGDAIKFKIAARASSDQPTGEYHNVINFTATAAPVPTTLSMAYANAGKPQLNGYYKLQDMSSSICNAADVIGEGSQMQAIDTRDNKVYWITKLADGKCWMTQNLDFDIGSTTLTHNSTTLYHDDTDLGYGTSTNQSWTPANATIDASAVTDNNIPGWINNNNVPYSVDPGDVYWNSFPFYSSISNTNIFLNNDWGSNPVKFQRGASFAGNGTHGHVGNYYNWSAAVANNDTSSYTSSTYGDISSNPQESICPANWRLPTISNQGNIENSTAEFTRLNGLYNSASTSTSENLEAAPLYFVRAGGIDVSNQINSGYSSDYWSSSVYGTNSAYGLDFTSSSIYMSNNIRRIGQSVRCVSR